MKKLLTFACDLVGLAALCILGVMASIAFSCTKLLMAGFLRFLLRLSHQTLTWLQSVQFPNLKILTRGQKTWVTLTLGMMTAGFAIEHREDGNRSASATLMSSQHTKSKPVDSSSSNN